MDPAFFKALGDIGVAGLLLFLGAATLGGLWKRLWVPGWMYSKLETENALLAETVTRLSEQLAREKGRNRRLVADNRRLGGNRASDAPR